MGKPPGLNEMNKDLTKVFEAISFLRKACIDGPPELRAFIRKEIHNFNDRFFDGHA